MSIRNFLESLSRRILAGRSGILRLGRAPPCRASATSRRSASGGSREEGVVRETGGAPRNPDPRNHFLMWIVKPSGCHCTDGHLTSRVSLRISEYRRVPTPPGSTSPFSEGGRKRGSPCPAASRLSPGPPPPASPALSSQGGHVSSRPGKLLSELNLHVLFQSSKLQGAGRQTFKKLCFSLPQRRSTGFPGIRGELPSFGIAACR